MSWNSVGVRIGYGVAVGVGDGRATKLADDGVGSVDVLRPKLLELRDPKVQPMASAMISHSHQ